MNSYKEINYMEKLIIVGLGATARHLYTFIDQHNLYEIIGFAVNRQYKKVDVFLDKPVYAIEELDSIIDKNEVKLFTAMLWNKLNSERRDLYNTLKNEGYKFANVISPTAQIRSEIKGDNCWLHDFVIVQNNTEIGSNNMIMAYTLIGADVKMGSHCFCGAKSTIGGGCTVGDQTFIGINSTIFDDRNVGSKCIIGACTAVKRNLEDNSLIKTTSDNNIIKRYSENEIETKLLFSKNVK